MPPTQQQSADSLPENSYLCHIINIKKTTMQSLKLIVPLLLLTSFYACNSGPEVVKADPLDETSPSLFQDPSATSNVNVSPSQNAGIDASLHKVVVLENLNTSQYSYMRVKENDQEFWIAVMRQEVKIGDIYQFESGLIQENFFSKEFNRTFDKLYLVSDFKPVGDSAGNQTPEEAHANATETSTVEPPKSVMAVPGSIKIADLVANLAKYDGKRVKVTGKVMKANPEIMGRNWLHLQDGSGKGLDLTVTTVQDVPPGSTVTMEGTLALNKDFGAGYKYDYILEGAVVK